MLLAASGVVVFGTGRPPKAPVAAQYPAPGPPLVAHWTNLSGAAGGLPAGVQVTSVVTWQGHLQAAGQYFPYRGAVAPGYPKYAPAMVWTSADGGSWRLVWYAQLGGSDAPPSLVVTPNGLLLFAGGTGGSVLWRSTDGVSFDRVSLPPTMQELSMGSAVYRQGRIVALVFNKYAGGAELPYGRDAPTMAWTSADVGLMWTRDALPGRPVIQSLNTSAVGFVATGESRPKGKSEVWLSQDGLTWTSSVPPWSVGDVVGLAANSNTIVAEFAQKVPTTTFWWSRDGRAWTRGVVRGHLYSPGVSPTGFLFTTTPGAFVTPGNPQSTLWSSRTGVVWTKVVNEHAADVASLDVLNNWADPQGLLAEAYEGGPRPNGENFWQVTFTRT